MNQYLSAIKLPNDNNPYVVGYNGNTWSWTKENDSEIGCTISNLQDGLYLLKLNNYTIVFEYLNKIPYVISAPSLQNPLDIRYDSNNLYIPTTNLKLTGLIFKEFISFSEPEFNGFESISQENTIKISLTSPIQHASVGYGTQSPSISAPYTIYIQTGVTTSG